MDFVNYGHSGECHSPVTALGPLQIPSPVVKADAQRLKSTVCGVLSEWLVA